LKNWSRKFALACATSSLFAAAAAPKHPAVAVVNAADAEQWQVLTKALDWLVISPSVDAKAAVDDRVEAIAKAVREAIEKSDADPEHIYLVGRADGAAAVFYTISRMPDLWAGGVAVGGSPVPAINSDRVFAANFTNTPVLWISGAPEAPALAAKLKSLGMNLELRPAAGLTNGAVLEWMQSRTRDPFPASIDCETNSPTFGRCYWVQMVKFDAAERNDVLPSTRVSAGSGAVLDLGEFAYKLDDPGPGLLISTLAPKYNGPLKVGDRIMELDGKPIANARAYTEMMASRTRDERVVALVQRGKERIRLETRVVLPHREAIVTARVQAKYVPDDKQIEIISRTVTEMRVTVPEQWVPSDIYWNGLALEGVQKPGCVLLTIDKEILHAGPCQ